MFLSAPPTTRPPLLPPPPVPKQQYRCGEPVHEVAAADGAELARSEESGDRDVPERRADGVDVVVRQPEERLAAAVAREEQRAGDRSLRAVALVLERLAKILARGLGVADLELDRLPHLHHVADGDRAGVAVDAHEVAHDEVATAQLGLQLGRGLPDVEAAPHEELVALARRAVELLDPLDRGLAAELEDDVLLRARHGERLAHRAAALRHDRARAARALEDRADRALAQRLVAEDEPRAALDNPARRHPTDDGEVRRVLVQVVEEQVRRERVRVREHDEDARRLARRDFFEAFEDAVLRLLRIRELERPDVHAGERRRPRRDGRRVLDLGASADHSAGDAAEQQATTKARVRALDDRLELVLELRRDEQEREVRGLAAQRQQRGAQRFLGRAKGGAASGQTRADAQRADAERGRFGHALRVARDRNALCRGPESNWRHTVLQTVALPTELPRRNAGDESGGARSLCIRLPTLRGGPQSSGGLTWCEAAAPTHQPAAASRRQSPWRGGRAGHPGGGPAVSLRFRRGAATRDRARTRRGARRRRG